MEKSSEKRAFSQWFFGEYSWGLKVSWILATIVAFYITVINDVNPFALLVNGDYNSALLLLILGYLSDFRYRFVREVRND
ncbi:hypothetical protein ACFSJY_15290 [Thalassotalea euphylliae]|uniref:hypothetical protein n=1 Tax=Thalassotalea euphylliae TaxID=1655234 RepID=UPI00363EF4DF